MSVVGLSQLHGLGGEGGTKRSEAGLVTPLLLNGWLDSTGCRREPSQCRRHQICTLQAPYIGSRL